MQKRLAQQLGISVRYLRKLKKLGMPTETLAAAKAWRSRNIDNPAADGITDLNALKGNVLRKRDALLALELQERRRELMPVAEAAEILTAIAASVKQRLIQIPDRFQGAHPGKVSREMFFSLQAELDAALALIQNDFLQRAAAATPPPDDR